jgi:hypothetical protein
MQKRGFAALAILLIILGVLLIAGGIWYYTEHPFQNPVVTLNQQNMNSATTSVGLITTTTELGAIPQSYVDVLPGATIYPRPVFSPDFHSYAYSASENGDSFIVINGQEGKHYNYPGGTVSIQSIVFSPNGQNVAYSVEENKQGAEKGFEVINGTEGKSYDQIVYSADGLPNPIFSADSEHYAYVALQNQKSVVVNDGAEVDTGGYVDIASLLFTPNDKLAYVVGEDVQDINQGPYYVVFDGKQGEAYDNIWNPVVSSDGSSIIYGAQKNSVLYSVSVNINTGVSSATQLGTIADYNPNLIGKTEIFFSPHRTRVAWEVVTGTAGNYVDSLMIDGKESATYGFVREVLLPDSPTQNVVVMVDGTDPGTGLSNRRIVIGNTPGPIFQNVFDLTMSPDQNNVAYFGQQLPAGGNSDDSSAWQHPLVINGTQVAQSVDGSGSSITFSGDDSTIAYIVLPTTKGNPYDPPLVTIVGNSQGASYTDITPPVFSADGKSVIYGARDGNNIWAVVQPVPENFQIPPPLKSSATFLTQSLVIPPTPKAPPSTSIVITQPTSGAVFTQGGNNDITWTGDSLNDADVILTDTSGNKIGYISSHQDVGTYPSGTDLNGIYWGGQSVQQSPTSLNSNITVSPGSYMILVINPTTGVKDSIPVTIRS